MLRSIALLLTCFVLESYGHGRLWLPPSRSSMWRQGFPNPANYNDHELFCGGYQNQWENNGGRCGVCGDPFQGPFPNEAGGTYANGIIGAEFVSGQDIEIALDITANHDGWHEFRLCVWNDVNTPITQDCLDEHLLPLTNGSTRVYQPPGVGISSWVYTLPAGVFCNQCVIQWRWNTGNRWGVDADTGEDCVGCGPQEQFYGCSDIAIGPSDGTNPPPPSTTPVTPTTSTDVPVPSTLPTTTTSTEDPVTSTPVGQTTTFGPLDEFCDQTPDGIYPHPDDCTQFIQCSFGIEYFNECPECTYYNPALQACDFPLPDNVCYEDVCSVLP